MMEKLYFAHHQSYCQSTDTVATSDNPPTTELSPSEKFYEVLNTILSNIEIQSKLITPEGISTTLLIGLASLLIFRLLF